MKTTSDLHSRLGAFLVHARTFFETGAITLLTSGKPMRRSYGPYTWSLFALLRLRTWLKRERWIVLQGHLSNAFSHCICTGRFGAPWFLFALLVLGYPRTAVWMHCRCRWLTIWIPYSFHGLLLGWVFQFDRSLLGRTRQQERVLYIPHQAPATGRYSSIITSSIPQEKSKRDLLSLGKS